MEEIVFSSAQKKRLRECNCKILFKEKRKRIKCQFIVKHENRKKQL